MRRSVRWMAALGAGTTLATSTGLLISCLDDPRAGEAFSVVTTCNRDLLSKDTRSVDQALRVYVDTTAELLAAAKSADTALKDACLAVYDDPALGIVKPADATTSAAACQPLNVRIGAANKLQPNPPGLNVIPPWVLLTFDERCSVPAGVREACLTSCGEPCDVSKCESPTKFAGSCPTECTGTCSTLTTDLSPNGGTLCTGKCIGEVDLPNDGPPSFGSTCTGECIGTCANGIYGGNCEGGCGGGFTGICGGTCYGLCGDRAVGNSKDAGSDAAVPPPNFDSGAVVQDPTNAFFLEDKDGQLPNCPTGICRGACSSKAYGSCYGGANGSRCVSYTPGPNFNNDIYDYTAALAPFSGAQCFSPGTCAGTCRSAQGTGSVISKGSPPNAFVQKCRGECTEAMKPAPGLPLPQTTICAGTCRAVNPELSNTTVAEDAGSPCSSDFDPATKVCEGRLNCNQNVECSNACEAKAALATVCADPIVLQAFAVTDPVLYAALRKFGMPIGKAVARLRKVQEAYSFIGNRNYGDFINLETTGLAFPAKGDLGSICAAEGAKNATEAQAILGPAVTADPTAVRRTN